MDCQKVGALVRLLRKEKGMTQLQLANMLRVSDKAISKWERGLGCPDVSLLKELAAAFDVSVESILTGELCQNDINGGNMKRVKFFFCPECGNILTCTGSAEITCCGRKLSPLIAKEADDKHALTVGTAEDDYYLTSSHEMTKEHHICFAALIKCDRILLVRLYAEQNCELRFPKSGGGTLVWYCSRDGLYQMKL